MRSCHALMWLIKKKKKKEEGEILFIAFVHWTRYNENTCSNCILEKKNHEQIVIL